MSGHLEHPPIRPICVLAIVTVPHFLIDCPDIHQARTTNFRTLYSRNISITLKILLGACPLVGLLMNYLKEIDIYDSI